LNLPDSQSRTLRLAQAGSGSQRNDLVDPESKGIIRDLRSMHATRKIEPLASIHELFSLLQPLMDEETSLSA
jgi:hypothetical protein